MKTKTCRFCDVELTEENKQQGKGIGNSCKTCYRTVRREYSAKRRESQREYLNEAARKSRRKLKEEVLGHYSKGELKCANCSFDDIRALSIDHVNGGGTAHRKSTTGRAGDKFYLWLRREGYPEGYQVLCMNCQFVKMHEEKENCHYQ